MESKMLVNGNNDYLVIKNVVMRSYNQDYVDDCDIDLIETFDRDTLLDICKDLVAEKGSCYTTRLRYNDKIKKCGTNTDLIEWAMICIQRY